MSTTRKIVIGVGLASGALLAAWLLTGSRKKKTKAFVAKSARTINNRLTKDRKPRVHEQEEADVHYV
jgi:3-polyprenyl-4-hydroxybenzoate decarboxylase